MKTLIKYYVVLAVLLFTAFVNSHAQQPSNVEAAVNEIVRKYEDVQGVSCMTFVKGGGLEIVKLSFKKQFGKEFMKGVTSITIIEYGDASDETCVALRKEFDVFQTLLQEFNLGGEKQFADEDYARCFALISEPGTLSDFVMALESGKSKMAIYMAGKIKFEEDVE